MKTMRKTLVTGLWVVSVATATLVAQIRYLPDAPGTWKPWSFIAYEDNRRQLAARPLDVKALEAQLLGLNAIIKKTEGFAAPIGFSVETVGNLELLSFRPSLAEKKPALNTLPLAATLNFGAYGVFESNGTGKAVRGDTGETAQLLFFVNQLALILFNAPDTFVPEFENLEADVVLLARPQPDLLGIPRYGDNLVLKKSAAPIWAAVSLGEATDLAIRGIQSRLAKSREIVTRLQTQHDDLKDPVKRAKRVAEYKALAAQVKDPGYLDKMMKVDAAMEANAATLLGPIRQAEGEATTIERELTAATTASAALSAADRVAPACYSSREAVSFERFKRAPADGCVALVRPNWARFNPALPRSAPQVLAIGHFSSCFVDEVKSIHAGGCAANRRLLESIDRQALLDWLK
jgi:hypothetical protein